MLQSVSASPANAELELETEGSVASPGAFVRRGGTLMLRKGRLSFYEYNGGCLLDAPASDITVRKAQWFRMGTAIRVVVGDATYVVWFKRNRVEDRHVSTTAAGGVLTLFGSMVESRIARATRRRWETAIARLQSGPGHPTDQS
jgi:hypothetical protein